jgi:hypothetical protein
MRHLFRLSTCVLLMLPLAAELSATTARRLSNAQLAQDAEVIVIGHVGESRSAWEGRTLVTLVTVTVAETLKGAPGQTLTVALPGGSDANRRFPVAMTYAGAPTMQPGEQVFLFLGHDDAIASGHVVLGFSQGKFSIVQNASGAAVVSRDLTTISLQTGAGVVPGTLTYTSLSEFKQEILGYLQ